MLRLFCYAILAVLLPTIPAPAEAQASRPNVVVVLLDDMRLDEMRHMPFTRDLFARTGLTFTHAISPHPLCCPARAALLTGQYAQRNGVRHNNPGADNGGYTGLAGKDNTLFTWYDAAGYRTAYTGKFLNGYKGGDIPGVDDNDASVGRTYAPEGVVSYNNGNPKRRAGHQTEFVTRRVRNLIRSYSEDSAPFFIWAGYLAPHVMKVKNQWVPSVPPDGYEHMGSHRGSLRAVDDSLRSIVRVLKRRGEWSNTIMVFASDNGLSNAGRKNLPYQDVVRVPLMIAGPGVQDGGTFGNVVTLVDLPATLSRMTGVPVGRTQDGINAFASSPGRAVLIQAGNARVPDGWLWQGAYTQTRTYVQHRSGKVENYDRSRDPGETRNLGRDPVLHQLLNSLR